MTESTFKEITPTQRFSGPQGKEFQFEIRVAGSPLLKSDKNSVQMIFGNLDGENFRRSNTYINNKDIDFHGKWLYYMAKEFDADLRIGMPICVVSPEGELIAQSTIQGGLPK